MLYIAWKGWWNTNNLYKTLHNLLISNTRCENHLLDTFIKATYKDTLNE